jgi:hypothetical protein
MELNTTFQLCSRSYIQNYSLAKQHISHSIHFYEIIGHERNLEIHVKNKCAMECEDTIEWTDLTFPFTQLNFLNLF